MCSRGCRTSASVCCGGLPFVWSSTRMDLAFIHDCAKRRGCNRLIYHFYQWMQELAGRESALGGREHFHLRARTSLVLTKGSLRANPNNEEAGFWFGAQTPKCAPGASPIPFPIFRRAPRSPWGGFSFSYFGVVRQGTRAPPPLTPSASAARWHWSRSCSKRWSVPAYRLSRRPTRNMSPP